MKKDNTIKPNELMLDDYVAIKCVDGSIINIQLTAIGQLTVEGKQLSNAKSSWAYCDELSPIPLTPEILEKNGRKVPKYNVWDLRCEGAEVQWVPETMDKNPPMQYRLAVRQKSFGIQDTLICHIEYVHELQHALKQCKIDKEIIL